jgi:hypothetical protein
MDLGWIQSVISAGSPLLLGVVGVVGAYYALRGRLDRHEDRLHRLENQKNETFELRVGRIEEKLRDEKFQEFYVWQTTVNNRLDALEARKR